MSSDEWITIGVFLVSLGIIGFVSSQFALFIWRRRFEEKIKEGRL